MSYTSEFLNQALSNSSGWGALNGLKEHIANSQEQQDLATENEAAIVKAALDAPAGRKFLEWLIAKTVMRSPGDEEMHAQTSDSYAIAKAKREGQNAIVFMILRALNTEMRTQPRVKEDEGQ